MDKKLPVRQGLRLREYDYSKAGAYFVTICVKGRECLLGNILDSKMKGSEYGKIVAACWGDLSSKYTVILDALVVMPNHVHAIIMIPGTGGETPPLQKPPSLRQIVGYFKYQATVKINEVRGTPGAKVWQRGYYEHVIRDDVSLNRIREYIDTNPRRWDFDRENPKAQGKDDFDRWLASFKGRPLKIENRAGKPRPYVNGCQEPK